MTSRNMKNLFTALFCFVVGDYMAQNFSFNPGEEYTAELSMETFTDHYIYINHDSPDSVQVSWRVVGNTCPEEWHISICDWPNCYSYLPNTGDMLPVGPGDEVFTKLTLNPYSIPGEGDVNFWIYPTGQIEEHVDMTYHFSTEVLGISDHTVDVSSIYPQPAADFVYLKGFNPGKYRVMNISGSEVMNFNITKDFTSLDLGSLENGIYFLQNEFMQTRKLVIR